MKECFIYTSARSKEFVEQSRKLEKRDTQLPVHYLHGFHEDKRIIPLSEKDAVLAIQKAVVDYSSSDEDYDPLLKVFSELVPGIKPYWDTSTLAQLKVKAKELQGQPLRLLKLAKESYELFIDESKLPVLCRNHTQLFPQMQEWFLCDQHFIPKLEYDKVHVVSFFDEVSTNLGLRETLRKFPTADFHLVVMTQLDLKTYTRVLSNYLGYKPNCKIYLEVCAE